MNRLQETERHYWRKRLAEAIDQSGAGACVAALNHAIEDCQPSAGLVHHSDCGTRYASNDYVKRGERARFSVRLGLQLKLWTKATDNVTYRPGACKYFTG